MCPTGQVNFQSGHVLIFPAVYINFSGLVQILAGHMRIFAGHVNFQNHVPDGHVNQMLNVKPCLPSPVAACSFTFVLHVLCCLTHWNLNQTKPTGDKTISRHNYLPTNGLCGLVAITGTTILIPYHPCQIISTHLEIKVKYIKSTGGSLNKQQGTR